ncbi:hypothetical protein PoB_004212300 [Plakobranchus ocellatus]|uniref:Uncharacterized protein n=1 Tax=Plakobranchus ocellatus TaxID=259542 RepID=A0AAV4B8Y7_9GAST|nr:hypothetical protein PoB_004212300 [Plakobranchus ocellatus]
MDCIDSDDPAAQLAYGNFSGKLSKSYRQAFCWVKHNHCYTQSFRSATTHQHPSSIFPGSGYTHTGGNATYSCFERLRHAVTMLYPTSKLVNLRNKTGLVVRKATVNKILWGTPFPLFNRATDVRSGCNTQRVAPTLRLAISCSRLDLSSASLIEKIDIYFVMYGLQTFLILIVLLVTVSTSIKHMELNVWRRQLILGVLMKSLHLKPDEVS